MKKLIVGLMVIGVLLAIAAPSYAKDKDWATAGKVLAIIEGARVLTGGNLDLIGTVTGTNRGTWNQGHRENRANRYAMGRPCDRTPGRVWVTNYVWQKKYIPEHEEYSQEYGTIIVGEHYIMYKVENDGYWE